MVHSLTIGHVELIFFTSVIYPAQKDYSIFGTYVSIE